MRFMLLFVLALSSLHVNAQDQTDYRLRVPSAAEYLALIPTLPIPRDQWAMLRLFDFIDDELQHLHPNLSDQPSSLVDQAYRAIVNTSRYDFRPWHKDYWNRATILSWLRESKIDLSAITRRSSNNRVAALGRCSSNLL